MEEREHKSGRRRGVLAAVLSAAAVAVALPVAGAFAAGDSGDASAGASGPGNVPVQAQQQEQRPAPGNDSAPRDGDCPEKDGSGGSSSDASVQF
jgi:hypothetical protein